ncbi:MAG: TIGR00180 family glycosyltransferase [Pseudomonadota bacterium]
MQSKLTVIIPTFNRPIELTFVIKYYASSNVNIFIGDSGSEQIKQQNFDYINGLAHDNIKWFPFEFDTLPEKIITALGRIVQTKYVCICPDDDFVSLKLLRDGASFLELHPDYSVASGRYVLAYPQGDTIRFAVHGNRSMEFDDPVNRICYIVRNVWPIVPSVIRTEVFNNAASLVFSETNPITVEISCGEVILNAAFGLSGKIKVLDTVGFVHVIHDNNLHSRNSEHVDVLIRPDFQQIIDRFSQAVFVSRCLGDIRSENMIREQIYSACLDYLANFYSIFYNASKKILSNKIGGFTDPLIQKELQNIRNWAYFYFFNIDPLDFPVIKNDPIVTSKLFFNDACFISANENFRAAPPMVNFQDVLEPLACRYREMWLSLILNRDFPSRFQVFKYFMAIITLYGRVDSLWPKRKILKTIFSRFFRQDLEEGFFSDELTSPLFLSAFDNLFTMMFLQEIRIFSSLQVDNAAEIIDRLGLRNPEAPETVELRKIAAATFKVRNFDAKLSLKKKKSVPLETFFAAREPPLISIATDSAL